MATEASLIIKVDSSQAAQADKTLASLAKSGATAEKSTDGLTQSTNAMASATRAAIGALSTLGAALSVREVIQLADAWRSAENQLRLVTDSAGELAGIEQELLGVANNTRSSYEATANLYARLNRATQEMGLSQRDLIGITTTINQSFAVSGATAAEAAAAITQLSQGLAAGALRGDEFNSVAEQAPGIMRAIADSLNMTVGELRSFAAEGGITAEIVVKALQQASDKIAGDFSKANMTFGQSMTVAKNNMLEFVGGSDLVQGSLTELGGLVVGLSNNMENLAAAAGVMAVAYSAQFIPAAAGAIGSLKGFATATETVITTTNVWGQRTTEIIATQSRLSAALGTTKAALLALAPAAAIAAAAAGFYLLVESQKESADAAWKQATAFDAVLAKLGSMTEKELVQSIMKTQEQIDKTQQLVKEKENEVKALRDGGHGYQSAQRELERLNLELTAHISNQKTTSDQLRRVQAGFVSQTAATKEASAATETFTRETRLARDGMEGANTAAWKAAEGFDILAGSSLGAKKAVIADVKDWEAAVNLAGKNVTKSNAEAAQASADEWRDFRNSVSDAFADMILDGESAGDAIVASFKRTFAKILADFAVSGISGMFTGQGLGGFDLGGALAGAGTSGKILSSVLGGIGGGGGAITAAQAAALNLPASAAGGGGIAAAVTGGLKSVATGASNLVSAIPGWGWALGAAALAVSQLDKSTPSHNAGMLLHDVPGAKPDQKFDVPAFASGFDPVGFARRENQQAATAVIDVFRQDDAVLTELAKQAGLSVSFNASTFRSAGLDENGKGDGVFMGSAREEGGGSGASIQSQRDAYVAAYVRGLSGQIGAAATAEILAAGSADAMINRAAELVVGKTDGSHANGLDYVPFDGYRATLHQGERVQTASQARADDSLTAKLISVMESMRAELAITAAATKRTADLLRRVTRDGDSLITEAA